MKFTFGIVTYSGHDGTDNLSKVNQIIDAIEQEEIPEYEIIIVGDYAARANKTRVIKFDETVKKGWITRRKILSRKKRGTTLSYTLTTTSGQSRASTKAGLSLETIGISQ